MTGKEQGFMNRNNQTVWGRCKRLAFASLVFAATGVHSATAAGVTVITHGWQLDQSYPAWVDNMAQAVTNAAGVKRF